MMCLLHQEVVMESVLGPTGLSQRILFRDYTAKLPNGVLAMTL